MVVSCFQILNLAHITECKLQKKGLVFFLAGRDGVNSISMEKMNTFPNKHMQ